MFGVCFELVAFVILNKFYLIVKFWHIGPLFDKQSHCCTVIKSQCWFIQQRFIFLGLWINVKTCVSEMKYEKLLEMDSDVERMRGRERERERDWMRDRRTLSSIRKIHIW